VERLPRPLHLPAARQQLLDIPGSVHGRLRAGDAVGRGRTQAWGKDIRARDVVNDIFRRSCPIPPPDHRSPPQNGPPRVTRPRAGPAGRAVKVTREGTAQCSRTPRGGAPRTPAHPPLPPAALLPRARPPATSPARHQAGRPAAAPRDDAAAPPVAVAPPRPDARQADDHAGQAGRDPGQAASRPWQAGRDPRQGAVLPGKKIILPGVVVIRPQVRVVVRERLVVRAPQRFGRGVEVTDDGLLAVRFLRLHNNTAQTLTAYVLLPEEDEARAFALERWAAFHEAVETLPAEQREVVGLTFYHGW